MIPLAIKLKGFLCYKDEQVATFDGSNTLWMLTGLNGSGKSAVFDALTYALFGHHRGGGQQAAELINKDSDGMLVEFDFLLDSREYRIKRTLRRKARGGASGTQQIFQRDPSSNGEVKWIPVENTQNKRDGFDPWIRERIGLDYDTFTSSVLLLQGRAEKLLDSKPEGRRAVLAGIVDLERYERLHRVADDQRKSLDAELKSLSHRLSSLPTVDADELEQADTQIGEAADARTKSRAEVDRFQGLAFQSQRWLELQQRRTEAQQSWERAQTLLGEAVDIEKDIARLKELRQVVPHVRLLIEQKASIGDAEKKIKELAQSKEQAEERTATSENQLRQERDKKATMYRLQSDDEKRHRDVSERLRQSAVSMEKLKQYERQENDLRQLREDLGELPAELDTQIDRARANVDAISKLAQMVPQLARFRTRREELRTNVHGERSASENLRTIRAKGEQFSAKVEELKPKLDKAVADLESASEQATEARTLLQQAQQSLREVEELGGAKVCRHCGQELTEGHLEEETRRRQEEFDEATKRAKQTEQTLVKARTNEKHLREELQQTEQALTDARLEYRDANALSKQAKQAVERLQSECAQNYDELDEAYRLRISPSPVEDWLATSYPEETDLASLRRETNSLDSAKSQLRKLESQQKKWNELKGQESSFLATLARLEKELPKNRETLRQTHADLEVEEQSLEKSIAARKSDLKAIEINLDRLAREREDCQASVNRITSQIGEQQLTKQHSEQIVERTRKQLPTNWLEQLDRVGLRSWSEWTRECETLEASGVEQRGKDLEQARAGLDVLRRNREELDAKQEDFAEEARRDPAEINALLVEARQQDQQCETALGDARQKKALLESYLKQRKEIDIEHKRLEAELMEYKLLAELLGRDRLQLYLVRQAERQVVDYANAVLDRLSGGQLYLRLSGEAEGEGSSAKALELEAYNRITGETPINVVFLSGSQKFRVAVSLALGIGQYASHQHRPIESVIIDEGFGCLDRQGRQVMIQELQNLRGHMRCILLVSHQEEFAEAFSDGYHFALEDGATRIKRMQK